MDIEIILKDKYNKKDTLIILCDKKDNLSWAKDILTKENFEILKQRIVKDADKLTLTDKGRFVFLYFVNTENKTEAKTSEEFRLLGSESLKQVNCNYIEKVTLLNKSIPGKTLPFIEGILLSMYSFTKYITQKKEEKTRLKQIEILGGEVKERDLVLLQTVVKSTNIARDLVNEPPLYQTAQMFSQQIEAIGQKYNFSVTVFDKAKIEELKMGGLLAVNKGSFDEPTFNILEWKPKKSKNKTPIVLVGKGVVYDTGGLSLKPTSNSMDYMKCDMAGGATVVGTIAAAAAAGLPVHLVGLIPATDNRPGNHAFVPGDVITMYSGHTVEILNTDAEGRLLLADALHYAKQYNPELVLDFATLTGAAARAIGPQGICVMGTASEPVKSQLKKSGENVYERLVEFPLWDEYAEEIKSTIADIQNLGGINAGMITAGKFLEFFVDYPWMHFDIAGPAYLHQPSGYRPKEGTGVGVRLLFDFLRNY